MAGAFKRKHQRDAGPAGKWTAHYIDHDGRRKYKAGFTDKKRTLELARKLEAEADLIRQGLIQAVDRTAREASRVPVAEHVAAYRDYLASKGGTSKHADHVCGAILRLLAESGVSRLSDLRPEGLSFALGRIRGRKSSRTANHALGSLRGWIRWLAGVGRLREVPGWLALLKPVNECVDRRRVRRALTEGEYIRLLEATSEGPTIQVYGRTKSKRQAIEIGRWDRWWTYTLAAETGLRAAELASLTPESFDLDRGEVTVEAGYSKRRRRDVMPIRRGLLEGLRGYLAAKPAGEPVFRFPSNGRTPKAMDMLRIDLRNAGIPERTAEGVIDFHSLRHTFISRLIERGVDPRTVQDLARHSTITLTIDRYSHSSEGRKRKAIEGDDK